MSRTKHELGGLEAMVRNDLVGEMPLLRGEEG